MLVYQRVISWKFHWLCHGVPSMESERSVELQNVVKLKRHSGILSGKHLHIYMESCTTFESVKNFQEHSLVISNIILKVE